MNSEKILLLILYKIDMFKLGLNNISVTLKIETFFNKLYLNMSTIIFRFTDLSSI